MIYDVVIIGGGIAGLSSGFFLKQNGATVALIDKNGIMSGASAAAGAFLHPAMGKPSNIKNFTDKAYDFAIDFYAQHCNYNANGGWLGAKDERSSDEFEYLGKYLPKSSKYYKNQNSFNDDGCGAFFVPSAGRISPTYIANILSKSIDKVFIFEALNIEKKEDIWNIDNNVFAKNIVYACGASDYLHDKPYLKAAHRGVWGQKAFVQATNKPQNAISIRGTLISEGLDNDIVAIGATHVPSIKPLDITRDISEELRLKASKYFDFGDAAVVSEVGGMRSASTDYFPIVGKIFDDALAFKMYPQMKDGLNPRELPFYNGLFVHYGHGSRAFTTSILTAFHLSKLILEDIALPKELDARRLLLRYARKSAIISKNTKEIDG